jgi:hypothetical protein
MRRYIMIGVKKRSFVVVLMFVLVLTATIWATNQEAKVVSTQWLKNNLSRPDIRIVDMRGTA